MGDLERVTRIELVTKAWEAAVIPFHHTRAGNEVAIQSAHERQERFGRKLV